jgi:hypothetical protein
MNQPWLRAGLIGAVAIVVVNLLGLLLGSVSLILQLIALLGVGVLAASFMLPRRQAGRAAGQGALAGLLAGIVSGIMVVIMSVLGFSQVGTQGFISQIPQQYLDLYSQMGVDPATIFTQGTVTAVLAACCLPTALIGGAILGALGGLVYAAAKPE